MDPVFAKSDDIFWIEIPHRNIKTRGFFQVGQVICDPCDPNSSLLHNIGPLQGNYDSLKPNDTITLSFPFAGPVTIRTDVHELRESARIDGVGEPVRRQNLITETIYSNPKFLEGIFSEPEVTEYLDQYSSAHLYLVTRVIQVEEWMPAVVSLESENRSLNHLTAEEYRYPSTEFTWKYAVERIWRASESKKAYSVKYQPYPKLLDNIASWGYLLYSYILFGWLARLIYNHANAKKIPSSIPPRSFTLIWSQDGPRTTPAILKLALNESEPDADVLNYPTRGRLPRYSRSESPMMRRLPDQDRSTLDKMLEREMLMREIRSLERTLSRGNPDRSVTPTHNTRNRSRSPVRKQSLRRSRDPSPLNSILKRPTKTFESPQYKPSRQKPLSPTRINLNMSIDITETHGDEDSDSYDSDSRSYRIRERETVIIPDQPKFGPHGTYMQSQSSPNLLVLPGSDAYTSYSRSDVYERQRRPYTGFSMGTSVSETHIHSKQQDALILGDDDGQLFMRRLAETTASERHTSSSWPRTVASTSRVRTEDSSDDGSQRGEEPMNNQNEIIDREGSSKEIDDSNSKKRTPADLVRRSTSPTRLIQNEKEHSTEAERPSSGSKRSSSLPEKGHARRSSSRSSARLMGIATLFGSTNFSGQQVFDSSFELAASKDVDSTGLSDQWFSVKMAQAQNFMNTMRLGDDDERVRIAVLDTGLDMDHLLLKEFREHGQIGPDLSRDFTLNSEDESDRRVFEDSVGHGTHCVSVVLKTCPYANVYMAKVFESKSATKDTESRICEAIEYAISEWNVDIISMSFAFTERMPEIHQAILDANSKRGGKILFFAASSNYSKDDKHPIGFPARMDSVISVFSATPSDGKSDFSPNGALNKANFSVPGEYINAAFPKALNHDNAEKRQNGTSVSTAILAGIAGLVIEFTRLKGAEPVRGSELLLQPEGIKAVFEKCMLSQVQEIGPQKYLHVKPWHLLNDERDPRQVANRIEGALDGL